MEPRYHLRGMGALLACRDRDPRNYGVIEKVLLSTEGLVSGLGYVISKDPCPGRRGFLLIWHKSYGGSRAKVPY